MSKFESAFGGYKLIYVFRMPYKDHEGALKVGEATVYTDDAPESLQPDCLQLQQAANKRIKQYTQTAGLKYELLYTELAITNKGKGFTDHDVHKVLDRSNIRRKKFEEVDGSKEWYMTELGVVKNAIAAVKAGRHSLNPDEKIADCTPIELRKEQKEAVKKTIKRFKSGHNRMLWYAKMRFGKTLTAMSLVKEMDFKRTIIITHRPVVKKGWFEDFEKLFCDKRNEYKFASRTVGEKFEDVERDAKHNRCKYLYFASIQDLRGAEAVGGNFDKNDAIFNTDWDLVIIDEAHEGTQTDLGKKIAELLVKEKTHLLQLSGTPFNLLENVDEDEVYTWDYIMEQRAKADWYKNHIGEPNPYAGLPKMHIFTYDMSEVAGGQYAEFTEDKYFNFSEFFKTDQNGNFVHHDAVRGFLDRLVEKNDDSNYPFSTQEYRDNFRHSLWMVPGVKAAKALSKMLHDHPVFQNFNIANVAGDGDEEKNFKDAMEEVRAAITDQPHRAYSITLSCGRLTTGVTVPEWTAVFMMAGANSTAASTYMQTIFRVQSSANINGRIKENCFVFDFAPDRTLKCVADSVKVSTRAGKTKLTDRKIMEDLLEFCPIISISGSKMNPYNVNGMLEQLKRAYIDRIVRNGFEDPNLFNNYMLLQLDKSAVEKFDALGKLVGGTGSKKNETEKNRDVILAENGMNPDAGKKTGPDEPKPEMSEEEKERLEKLKEAKSKREKALKALKGVAIRIPMLIYGADIDVNTDIDMERFVDMVDQKSWDEFMPSGIDKQVFKQFIPYFDRDAFIGAGKEIRQRIKRADRMEPTTRTRFITALFSTFKNPDKETVLTPWRVVNMHMGDCVGGYNFYDTEYKHPIPDTEDVRYMDIPEITDAVFGPEDTKILEINSKSGLYPLYVTYTIWRKRCTERGIDITQLIDNDELHKRAVEVWDEVLQKNVYIICKTQMAKSITQRTLCGYRDGIKINGHAFENLVTMIKDGKAQKFIEKAKTGSTYNARNKETNMKFSAVVGNPPYQVIDGGGTGSSAQAIYNRFVDMSRELAPDYISMIMPSRWMTGGKGLDDFRASMLNDKRIRILHDYLDARFCFPTVSIEGGVCYFLWNGAQEGKCKFVSHSQNSSTATERFLADGESDIVIRDAGALAIVNKVHDTDESFSSLVHTRNLFKIDTKELQVSLTNGGYKVLGRYGQKRGLQYLKHYSTKDARANSFLGKYKVFISKADGAAGQLGNPIPARIIGKAEFGMPDVICTETFLAIGPFDTEFEAKSVVKYMATKFFRFLVGARKLKNMTQETYSFVPQQDYTENSDIDWQKSISEIDKQLYTKYGLNQEEIDFIEIMVKPME